MKSFKEYNKSLKEGFLDDDNKEQLTADNFDTSEEKEAPFPVEEDDLTEPNELSDDDVDLSDEIGNEEAEADKTEKEDLADLKLDELSDDDNVKDSGDEKQEEKKAEQETAERTADVMAELKDAIANLTTKIDALNAKVDNSEEQASEGNAEVPVEEGDLGDLDNLDLPEDDSAESGSGEESSSEGNAEAPAESEEQAAPAEGNAEGSEEENANEGSDEDFGDEADDTKTEAYNFYCKKGKLLNSNSGSIVGKAVNDKLYDLQEAFENIAKAKIRQLIEAEKIKLRESHFNF